MGLTGHAAGLGGKRGTQKRCSENPKGKDFLEENKVQIDGYILEASLKRKLDTKEHWK